MKNLLFCILVLFIAFPVIPVASQIKLPYQSAPESMEKILQAIPTPNISLNKNRTHIIIKEIPNLPSISEIAINELKLAGLRINPATNGKSRSYSYNNIKFLEIKSGKITQITNLPENPKINNITWSPDGKMIAYFSNDTANRRSGILKILSLKDGVSHVLTKLKTAHIHREITWSPDSKRIAFNYGPETENYGKLIRIISIDDGSIEDIETGMTDVNMYHLDWSPDGKRFAFSGYKGDTPELWLLENFLPKEE